VYLEELFRHIEFVSSKRFIDFFETQVSKEVEAIRSSANPKSRKMKWATETRQSLRYAFFLRYYASFESHLKGVCDYRAKKETLPVQLSDINGRGFLQQVNKYLTQIAKRSPLDVHPLWSDVLAYNWVRNAIIHNDGQVRDPKAVDQFVKRLLARPTAGLSITKERIVVRRAFCYRAISVMERFLFYVIES
jgi:hypothetical protein